MATFIWPVVAPISQNYGTAPDGSFHPGVDLSVPPGTPVRASAIGVVSEAKDDGAGGNTIIIQDPGGYETVYAHLQSFNVSTGGKVSQGQIIGYSGGVVGAPGAGNSNGPHLHFQVDQGQGAIHNINPIPLLPTSIPSNVGAPTKVAGSSIASKLLPYLWFGALGSPTVRTQAEKIPVVGSAVSGVTNSLATISSLKDLSLKRIGLGALGAVIIILAVVKLTSDSSIIKGAIR